jgi:predicted ATPase
MRGAQVIGSRWEITGMLGEGGMGDVYRGLDRHTGETVAIKLLKPDMVDAVPGMIERFQREAQLLRQLNHPNIVRILDAVEEDDLHYLIMEYLPGGSLKDLLQTQSPLRVERALDIALDLTDALTRAHRLHVIHRDLKPANVLLAEDGTPRLTDFGMARVVNSTTITLSGTLVGTLGYVSPEACRGQPLDARADIWSFGVMLYEMLAGVNPFDHEQLASTISSILNDPVPDLEYRRLDVPVALADLIYRMLEKNWDFRISSMRLVGAELEAIQQGSVSPLHEAASRAQAVPDPAAPPKMPAPIRGVFRHDLVAQPPFVGREAELARLERLVSSPQTRLVTIAAPGGMGKTRLAAEFAAQQVGKYPDGVYFVPMAGLSRVEDVVLALADTIHFGFALMGDRREQLLAFLSNPDEQQMLLVLDNVDHLLEAVPLISEIIQAAPGLQVLATSRVRLNLSSEIVLEIGGMDISPALAPDQLRHHEAIKLFEYSAQRVQPDFELKNADLPHVAQICRSVFGTPLGIVLAAGWAGMLTPEEIAHEIEISLDFLETDAQDVPERQRSLRAVFESSWAMLTDTERDAFMKLSIFQGGVKRAIAQYISGASLQTLAALVKKSLLRRDPDSGRYQVHELLRQYAAEALDASGKTQATRDVHCYFFMSLSARHHENLRGLAQAEAMREIDADYENMRAAWSWAVQHKNAAWVNLGLNSLFLFCTLVGEYDELAGLMAEARSRFVPAPGSAPDALWRRLAIRYELARTPYGSRDQILALLELARGAGDRAEEAFCLWTLGYSLSAARDYAGAVPIFRDSLSAYQALGDSYFVGRVMSDVGLFSAVTGQFVEAYELLRQSGEMEYVAGDAVGASQARMRMGLLVP